MKKVVLVILVGLYSMQHGQSQRIDQGLTSKKKTEFGFNLGAFHTLIKSDDPLPENFKINNSTGFRLGVLMNHNLGEKNFHFSKGRNRFFE